VKSLLQALGRQNWLRFGLRDRIIRAIFNPDKISSHEFILEEFNGNAYPGNLDNFIDWSAFFYGAYEKELLEKVALPILRADASPSLIDIGANIGHHSIYLSSQCNAVHACEPDPTSLAEFNRKIKIGTFSNILLHNVALGYENAEATLYSSSTSNKGTNSLLSTHTSVNTIEHRVKVLNADAFVSSLNLSSITLIKLDVEGYELNVLKGLTKTLSKFRPAIIVEISHTTRLQLVNTGTSIRDLIPKNYRFYHLSTRNDLLFIRREFVEELFSDVIDSFVGDIVCIAEEKNIF